MAPPASMRPRARLKRHVPSAPVYQADEIARSLEELELWGGHECTVNSVGVRSYDQTVLSGHAERVEDLDLFAALGVRALRYPVLWERVAPDRPNANDWSWSDQRLIRIRELGMRPIVGLLHHGCGPAYTGLMQENFAGGLADHALGAARRYPWVRDWTPVNEPLTTARFSAQYGHWRPHRTDERSFWTCLLNQIDATRLAMRAIRSVNPSARLIQTEDLGRTYSTQLAADQASFDNARRWMTWDLLCGRVGPDHVFWERLGAMQLGDRLRAIRDDPCPPDVVGVNHYLTSDRFLDHRLERYPRDRHGRNGDMAFADVEAIRVLQPAPGLIRGALEEAWNRYHVPIAVTEVHNGCTREEQLRWMVQAWSDAMSLRGQGVPVEAVTAWALLGSHGWSDLLTRQDGRYESGVFDVSGGHRRPTRLASILRELAATGDTADPIASGPGWWTRDVRFEFQPVACAPTDAPPRDAWSTPQGGGRPILITGATGTLGQALARACQWRGLDYVLTDRRGLHLEDEASMRAALERHRPWAVINAAGWVRVDEAEGAAEACLAANYQGPMKLALACQAMNVHAVFFSSDLVFDGRGEEPLVESDRPKPLNQYGVSKARLEAALQNLGGDLLTIRTAAFFSPHDPHNFAAQVKRALEQGRMFRAPEDVVISPAYVPDLVNATLDLLIDRERGLWHLTNPSTVSWAGFARAIAEALGLSLTGVIPVPWRELGWIAPRPHYVALASERGRLLPPLEDALARYAAVLAKDPLRSSRNSFGAANIRLVG